MSGEPQLIHLNLQVDLGAEADAEELDRAARQLRAEALDVGVEAATPLAVGPAPPGSKSAEAVVLGALALAILPATLSTVLTALSA